MFTAGFTSHRLPAHIPVPSCLSVVHGDYRLDNLIIESDGTRVLATLDWELSTLGDPLTDLAYNCLVYHLPPNDLGLSGLFGTPFEASGIPVRRKLYSAPPDPCGG